MKRSALIASSVALDAFVGDPPLLPHPVSFIALAAKIGEPRLRAWIRNEYLSGSVLSAGLIVAVSAIAAQAQRAPKILRSIVGASTLAARSLIEHADRVCIALEKNDLMLARDAVGRIVGRDTTNLNESEIARATIETLAESFCDGVVAPLVFLSTGGLPGALAYKAVNTLDSLIGHIEEPYTRFGWFAAKLDDVCNYAPARIAALALLLAGQMLFGTGLSAFRVWKRDCRKHRSPNAGHTEAAIAGVLRVRLGGSSTYERIMHEGALLGSEFARPKVSDVRRAMHLVITGCVLTYGIAIGVAALIERQ